MATHNLSRLPHRPTSSRRDRPKVIPIDRKRIELLRAKALAEKSASDLDLLHDRQPNYQPMQAKKGARVVETIAPHRFGKYLKPLGNSSRWDLCLVQWSGRDRPEVSSLLILKLQEEQLSLF